MQIHYHPDGKDETDQSLVGIYFTPKPARTIVGGIAVRTPQPRHPARREAHTQSTAESAAAAGRRRR